MNSGMVYPYLLRQSAGAPVSHTLRWHHGGGYNLGSGVDVGLDLQMSEITQFGGASWESQSAGLVLSVSF